MHLQAAAKIPHCAICAEMLVPGGKVAQIGDERLSPPLSTSLLRPLCIYICILEGLLPTPPTRTPNTSRAPDRL